MKPLAQRIRRRYVPMAWPSQSPSRLTLLPMLSTPVASYPDTCLIVSFVLPSRECEIARYLLDRLARRSARRCSTSAISPAVGRAPTCVYTERGHLWINGD